MRSLIIATSHDPGVNTPEATRHLQATNYEPLGGGNRWQVMPRAGRLRALYVQLSQTLGAGVTLRAEIYRFASGQPREATGLAVEMTATDSGKDLVNYVDVAEGELLGLAFEEVAGSVPTNYMGRCALILESGAGVFVLGPRLAPDQANPVYFPISGGRIGPGNVASNSAGNRLMKSAINGAVKRVYVKSIDAPDNGDFWDFALAKNGTEVLSGQIEGPNDTFILDGDIAIAPGDNLEFAIGPASSSPGAMDAHPSMLIVPDNADDIPLFGGHVTQDPFGTTRYAGLNGDYGRDSGSLDLASNRQITYQMTLLSFYAQAQAALSGSEAVRMVVMKNGAETGLDLTLNSSAQSANVTATVTFDPADTAEIKLEPTDSPSPNTLFWGFQAQSLSTQQTIGGKANIRNAVDQTIGGRANIRGTTSRTILAKANIKRELAGGAGWDGPWVIATNE